MPQTRSFLEKVHRDMAGRQSFGKDAESESVARGMGARAAPVMHRGLGIS
ncbi:hypothetical protein [Chelativorans sp. M5D2P16]|nr:hypothetical protein [Chelativorans sp. M5D2P16]MDZ5700083.1 hypothetical protein [Chelativorans sp. M5D2P16]